MHFCKQELRYPAAVQLDAVSSFSVCLAELLQTLVWPQNLASLASRACVQVTFAEQLGAAKHDPGDDGEGVSSKNEAKKLAFYLYWNVKP